MPFKDPDKAREYNSRKKKEYYHKDVEASRKKGKENRRKYKRSIPTDDKQREYSRRYYLKNTEKVKSYSREYRELNREGVNEKQRERNRRVDPTIEIGDAIRSFIRGDISDAELCRRVQSVIDKINEKLKI